MFVKFLSNRQTYTKHPDLCTSVWSLEFGKTLLGRGPDVSGNGEHNLLIRKNSRKTDIACWNTTATLTIPKRKESSPSDAASSTERPFQCPKCPGRFSAKGQLNRHTRRVHDKIRTEACEKCGRMFFSKADRDRHHLHVHENSRPFKCTKCDASFKTKQHLLGHIRSVHDKGR